MAFDANVVELSVNTAPTIRPSSVRRFVRCPSSVVLAMTTIVTATTSTTIHIRLRIAVRSWLRPPRRESIATEAHTAAPTTATSAK